MADDDAVFDLMRESAAEHAAMINGARPTGLGKVTCVVIDLGARRLAFRLHYNEFCDDPVLGGLWPMDLYHRLVTGKTKPPEIRAILSAGLKGAERLSGGEARIGPTVDSIMDDYPYSTAVSIAETVLAAWLVGIDPPAKEK